MFVPNGRYQNFEVYNQLIGDAELLNAGDFGDSISAAHWRRNADVMTRYTDPDHHTISLYVNGGTGIKRQIGPDPLTGGGPGRCCLMPAHLTSDWVVNGEVELFHLYIPHSAWERAVVEAFDIEPNAVEVPEKTFFLILSRPIWISRCHSNRFHPRQGFRPITLRACSASRWARHRINMFCAAGSRPPNGCCAIRHCRLPISRSPPVFQARPI